MASVSDAKISPPGSVGGEFCVETFNLFKEEDRKEYALLRTSAEDGSNGIVIENIREFTYKSTTTTKGDDGEQTSFTTEDLYLVVQYWNKKPKKQQGGTNDEVKEAIQTWSSERTAR